MLVTEIEVFGRNWVSPFFRVSVLVFALFEDFNSPTIRAVLDFG